MIKFIVVSYSGVVLSLALIITTQLVARQHAYRAEQLFNKAFAKRVDNNEKEMETNCDDMEVDGPDDNMMKTDGRRLPCCYYDGINNLTGSSSFDNDELVSSCIRSDSSFAASWMANE